jgi:hypothetical protein
VGGATGRHASRAPADGEASGAPIADAVCSATDIDDVRARVGEQDSGNEPCPALMVDLPNVACISAHDGSRAPGDLEDQAARYHPARHELTINADFRAISDLITHWQDRYKGVAGARAVIEAPPRRRRTPPLLTGNVLPALGLEGGSRARHLPTRKQSARVRKVSGGSSPFTAGRAATRPAPAAGWRHPTRARRAHWP